MRGKPLQKRSGRRTASSSATQITYVVSGSFEFEIDGVRRVIKPGDALLKRNDIEHGCVCLEDGILLDIFTPMRQEFV